MIGTATLTGWHPHLEAWFLLGIPAFAYLRAVSRHPEPTSRGQKVKFLSGVAVLLVGSDWPLHDIAENFLYSAHMTQHLLFTLVGALLLVAGTPAWMARRILAPRWLASTVRVVARPVPALIQANVILVLSHWPLVVNVTVRNHPLHFVAHTVLLVSAILMWLPVASPLREVPRLKPPLQMLYLFGQTILPTIPASFLTFGSTPLYQVYTEFPRLWGVSVLSDQQIAGLIMKVGAGFYLWIVITVVFFKWCARENKAEEPLIYEEIEPELLK